MASKNFAFGESENYDLVPSPKKTKCLFSKNLGLPGDVKDNFIYKSDLKENGSQLSTVVRCNSPSAAILKTPPTSDVTVKTVSRSDITLNAPLSSVTVNSAGCKISQMPALTTKPPKILFTKEVLHKSYSDPVQAKRRGSKGASFRLYPPPLSPSSKSFRKRGSPVSKCTLKLDGYSYMIGKH